MEKLKEKICNRIWNTKKIRMNSERRFLFLDKRNLLLNVYYSLFILIFSVLTYVKKDSFKIIGIEDPDLLLLVSSIILFTFSIYSYSHSFKERADRMKKCYTDLSKLEVELEALEPLSFEKIAEINNRYQEILNNHENQLEEDYLRSKESKNLEEWLKYICYLFKLHFLNILYFLLPFLITYTLTIILS